MCDSMMTYESSIIIFTNNSFGIARCQAIYYEELYFDNLK